LTTTQPNHFDRSKPFYPLIVSFAWSLHGFVELVSRGLVDQVKSQVDEFQAKTGATRDQAIQAVVTTWRESSTGQPADNVPVGEMAAGSKTPLFNQLKLAKRFDGVLIEIDPDELASEVLGGS